SSLGVITAQTPQPVARHSPAATTISRTAGLQLLDGELWGGAQDYKVRFAADAVTLTPALGKQAPRDYPLTLRLESVGRGATFGPLTARAPTFAGLRVEYDRGVAVERYDLDAAGLEQSFVFATRPQGSGDLVVRVRLATDLQVTADADGL